MTVTRWCKSGKLAAFPRRFGKKITFDISVQAVELALQESVCNPLPTDTSKRDAKSHLELMPEWICAMEQGLITGKPYSVRTVDDYRYHVEKYLQRYKMVSIDSATKLLKEIPVKHFAKREHLYKAILCFSKYLNANGYLEDPFIDGWKALQPKRHIPPSRLTVDEPDLNKLVVACETPLERLIIILLSTTGLRASEACSLQLDDLNFEKRTVLIRLGKGKKRRTVGMGTKLVQALNEYLKTRQGKSRNLFLNRDGFPMDASGLFQRVQRIGKKAGIKANPHSLRRAFVTINHGKGRPLVHLQIAAGHSDIHTTRSYCMTTEQEVIEAMKGWD